MIFQTTSWNKVLKFTASNKINLQYMFNLHCFSKKQVYKRSYSNFLNFFLKFGGGGLLWNNLDHFTSCLHQDAACDEGCRDSASTFLSTISGGQQSDHADREPTSGADQHAGE